MASSHSGPRTRNGRLATWPGACCAIEVLRQNRIFPSSAGMVIVKSVRCAIQGARERILGAASIGWRAEPRVAPKTGPDRARVELLRRLLVADQCPTVVLPARLPEHRVAREVGQVHAAREGGFDAGALTPGHVLVVS